MTRTPFGPTLPSLISATRSIAQNALRTALPALFLAASLHAATGPADTWRSTLAPRDPGPFPPLPDTAAAYRIEWSGAVAARASITLRSGTMRAKAATTGIARSLWKLDATFESAVSPDTLLPIRVSQREAYAHNTVTTRLAFTPDTVTRARDETPPPATPHKAKRFKYPDARDFHAAYLFVRSQPLAARDRLRFVVFAGSDGYLATLTVAKRENVALRRSKFPAIRCDLALQKLDRKLGLVPHTKFRSASIWLSDDPARLPLKARVQAFIGTVSVELESSTPPLAVPSPGSRP